MENAAEALKLAAAVLIFVLALSICVNAFAEARIASQTILDYRDREFESEYLDYNRENTERIVGIETIVPSIYKAYKESYKIVFDEEIGLYQEKQDDGTWKPINYIDLKEENLASGTEEKFIKVILYGKNSVEEQYVINFEAPGRIKFYEEGLYNKIKGMTFYEKSGIYYIDEVDGATDGPIASKRTKRVITYEGI